VAATTRDDTVTLMAAGVLAYVGETLLHEAVGHGGVCLASGLRFTMLAPLWMRCSEFSPAVVAAGPAANVLAGAAFMAILLWRRPAGALWSLLLWLGFVFNALVACGYLGVGAATGFGDWPVLFDAVSPSLAWRIPAILVAVAAYYACLRAAARLFRRFSGSGAAAAARLWRRAMLAGAGAAIVACAAEVIGGRAQPLPLLLALGTTLVVGFSVTSMNTAVMAPQAGDLDQGDVGPSRWVIVASIVVAVGFVSAIGPGLNLTGLNLCHALRSSISDAFDILPSTALL
jgi:multisubunit Na+/H+ antiporter MnhC subunit